MRCFEFATRDKANTACDASERSPAVPRQTCTASKRESSQSNATKVSPSKNFAKNQSKRPVVCQQEKALTPKTSLVSSRIGAPQPPIVRRRQNTQQAFNVFHVHKTRWPPVNGTAAVGKHQKNTRVVVPATRVCAHDQSQLESLEAPPEVSEQPTTV